MSPHKMWYMYSFLLCTCTKIKFPKYIPLDIKLWIVCYKLLNGRYYWFMALQFKCWSYGCFHGDQPCAHVTNASRQLNSFCSGVCQIFGWQMTPKQSAILCIIPQWSDFTTSDYCWCETLLFYWINTSNVRWMLK